MTNQQLYLTIGLPTLTSLITLILVCLAWLSGRGSDKEFRSEMRHDLREFRTELKHDISELRTEMKHDIGELRTEVQSLEARFDKRFDSIDAELRYFHGSIGNHEARLTLLEKR